MIIMEKYRIYFTLLLATLLAAGCEKSVTTQDHSVITHYVTFDLNDVNQYNETLVKQGTAYVDPGYTAMEGTTDVTGDVQVSGDDVSTDSPGVYHIYYSAVNQDGFSASANRTVIVYPATPPSGDLSGDYAGIRVGKNAGGTVTIDNAAPAVFRISDLFGGYYDQYAGYGKAYAAPGYLLLNADNSVEVLYGYVNGWATVISGSRGAYYPDSNTITFGIMFEDGTGFGFDVQLTKN